MATNHPGQAQEHSGPFAYPFELPAELSATLTIDANEPAPVNAMLLGLNCNWPEGLYGKVGYNHPDAQRLIKTLQPSSLRFPHGVWSNFYDWESDGRRMNDDYVTPYDSAVKDHPELRYGFDGFHELHDALSFEVVHTWNVNYDDVDKSVRRLKDRQSKGFPARWIELGNETFWKTQRSESVRDVEKYIEVAKAHATALRSVSPQTKFSVPVHWRNAVTDPWNQALMKEDFYDAITIHKHMNYSADAKGVTEAFSARQTMVDMSKALQSVFPGKPQWVTEWSVSCGENSLSTLAMASALLSLFDEPAPFQIADYFQINASHPLIHYDRATQVHSRTAYGAAYQVIRDALETSEILPSDVESTKIQPSFDAVSAQAVRQNGKTIVVAINKTNRSVPLTIAVKDDAAARQWSLRSLAFDDTKDSPRFPIDADVLETSASSSPVPILPPLSINRIEIVDP
ncbi:hypothetical protein [Rubripirellula tenax]|nr:hypothetical protein [Rubripirellula tenax]